MSENQQGIPDQLRMKFPQLTPIKTTPRLFRMNGCGMSVYGKRDYDAETQTYVKTYAICVLFIPLIALGAYRVVDARSGGWYFIGKEPLSNFARSWNMAMGLLAIFGVAAIAWNIHTTSPEYLAREQMQRASEFMQAGKPMQAAGIYRQQLFGPLATDARGGLQKAIETCLQADKAQTVAAALHLLAGLPVEVNRPTPLVPDAFDRGFASVVKFSADNPDDALEILNSTAELDPNNAKVPPLRIDLLKRVIAAHPDNTNRVVDLAVIYENNKQMEECWQLLRPYKDRLGATEGARILGQKLLEEQNYSDAYGLLFPYVQTRLARLHDIELSYSNTMVSVSSRAYDDLNAGKAGQDFYDNYKAASKAQKDEMVNNFIEGRMKTDPAYLRALDELKEANRIVPVTLDLGIVQLNRAQELKDPAARKTELEAAEKTFLAIRGFAGETDEYRLFLGQVYYWLGKSKEGHDLFEQLLASRKRNFSILMSICETLRNVGETLEARNMAEEAYSVARAGEQKYGAASMRALLCKDEDDRIAWLQKADPDAAWVQIELNESRGRKALQQGNRSLAANLLGKAVSGYETQPKTSAELNNWALACFDLYEATGNVEVQKKGMSLFEEAVAIDPGDSILLHNVTYYLISRAVMDVNRDAIDFALLGEQAGLDSLGLFYQDDQGRTEVYQRLHDSDAMKKGLGYLDKALLLAPKEVALYSTALALQAGFRDLAALQKLQQRFQIAVPDLTESKRETLDAYVGAKDKEDLAKIQKRMDRLKEMAARCSTNGEALTLEYINISFSQLQQKAWHLGGEVDGQAMVQSALAAYQRHPSSASHETLETAYFFLANQELALQDSGYAALVKQCRHVLSPGFIVAFSLERGGPLADLVRKNANVAKVIEMEKESMPKYPSWAGIHEWAMLCNTDPSTAALVARRIKENEAILLRDSLEYQFDPYNASLVLDQYWMQKLLGDEKHASEIYQTALHDGVPLPPI